MSDPIRVAKRVAELRACSRREAEQLIAGGWVRVDGVMVEEPHFRVTDQHADIDPTADPAHAESVTLLLHKPPGHQWNDGDVPASRLLSAASLWPGDDTGIRPLKRHFAQLTACVPLETEASGLIVFTQDWRVARSRRSRSVGKTRPICGWRSRMSGSGRSPGCAKPRPACAVDEAHPPRPRADGKAAVRTVALSARE